MKDIKKGDYIRTPYGIVKYVEDVMLFDCDCDKSFKKVDVEIHCDDYEFIVHDDEIIKSNSNILELLEEQDLVKIEFYSPRYEERVTRLFEVTFKDEQYINLDNAKCQFMLTNGNWSWRDKKLNPVIKSVITKEQFSQMEYRIGE